MDKTECKSFDEFTEKVEEHGQGDMLVFNQRYEALKEEFNIASLSIHLSIAEDKSMTGLLASLNKINEVPLYGLKFLRRVMVNVLEKQTFASTPECMNEVLGTIAQTPIGVALIIEWTQEIYSQIENGDETLMEMIKTGSEQLEKLKIEEESDELIH